MVPGKSLSNLLERMKQLDQDPEAGWTPADLMPFDEASVLIASLQMGEMLVTQTAEYARQVLAHWPRELVAHPIADEARVQMFLIDPVKFEDRQQDIARRVLREASASDIEVSEHPELQDLDPPDLIQIWTALVFWFGIKSGMLNAREQGRLPQ